MPKIIIYDTILQNPHDHYTNAHENHYAMCQIHVIVIKYCDSFLLVVGTFRVQFSFFCDGHLWLAYQKNKNK
jgi:hypothetical protein